MRGYKVLLIVGKQSGGNVFVTRVSNLSRNNLVGRFHFALEKKQNGH